MSDDIVTQLQSDIAFRLRLQAKVSNLYEIHHPHMVRVATIYEEAADEIERLRASVVNTFENAADEIERLQKELEFYKGLYADGVQLLAEAEKMRWYPG